MMYYQITEHENFICLIVLCMLTSEAVVHESIPSTNIPLPGRSPGLCTYFRPRYRHFYHLNCLMAVQGSGLFYDILSSKLLVDAALRHYIFQLQTDLSTIAVFQ